MKNLTSAITVLRRTPYFCRRYNAQLWLLDELRVPCRLRDRRQYHATPTPYNNGVVHETIIILSLLSHDEPSSRRTGALQRCIFCSNALEHLRVASGQQSSKSSKHCMYATRCPRCEIPSYMADSLSDSQLISDVSPCIVCWQLPLYKFSALYRHLSLQLKEDAKLMQRCH